MEAEQLALFDDLPQPSVPVPQRFPTDSSPRYERITGCAKVYCDDCVLALQQNRWQGPTPLGAGWTASSDGQVLRLCEPHYQLARLAQRRAA